MYESCYEMTFIIDSKEDGVEVGIHNLGRKRNGETAGGIQNAFIDSKLVSHINWDPSDKSYGGNTTASLGHELAYSYDRVNHITDLSASKKPGEISDAEYFATHVENKIRASLGLKLRNSYFYYLDGRSPDELLDGRSSIRFDSNECYIVQQEKITIHMYIKKQRKRGVRLETLLRE